MLALNNTAKVNDTFHSDQIDLYCAGLWSVECCALLMDPTSRAPPPPALSPGGMTSHCNPNTNTDNHNSARFTDGLSPRPPTQTYHPEDMLLQGI